MKTVYMSPLLSILCAAGSACAAQPPGVDAPPPLAPIHVIDCTKAAGPCPAPPASPAPPAPPAPPPLPSDHVKPHRNAHGARPPAPPAPPRPPAVPQPPMPPMPPEAGPQLR